MRTPDGCRNGRRSRSHPWACVSDFLRCRRASLLCLVCCSLFCRGFCHLQSVEYADAHTRSEERLRNSEADCAALWEEREEAKERLCAAFVEGRALEERLDEAAADALQLRQALEDTQTRLAAADKEVQEASGMKTELQGMVDRCVELVRTQRGI